MKKIKNKFLRTASLSVLLIIKATSSNAAQWELNAGVNQSLSYDDNVIMRKDPEASLIYAVTPSVNFSHRTDVSEVSANASYGYQRYFDISRFNRDNQHYGINGRYDTELITWALTSTYSIAPARNTAAIDSGVFDINSKKEAISILPSISYKLSELDNLLLSFRYSDVSFSSNIFSDYENTDYRVSWERKWTERYTSSLQVFYSNYKGLASARNPDIKNDSVGVNISSTYLLLENWQLIGTVGYRSTETKTDSSVLVDGVLSSTTKDTRSDGYLLDSSIIYTGEQVLAKLNVNQSLVPSSQGRLQEQLTFGLDLQYKLTERLSAKLLTSYRKSDSVNRSGSNKRTNYIFNPSLNWMFNPNLSLNLSYRYAHQKRTIGIGEVKADSNLYMLSVNYNWDGFRIAR